ncbi:MAG TPA: hypothetical protein VGH97_11765 [Thermoanaerobaculia bacterium]
MAAAMLISLIGCGSSAPKSGFESGSRVASPEVVASWIALEGSADELQLRLLVLWRGSPGWFLKGESAGSSGKAGADDGGANSIVQHLRYGKLNLEVGLDLRKQTATIAAEKVDLGDANVILVDDVDNPAGPRVVRTLRVNPALSKSVGKMEEVVRRSPELFEFLRCDVELPDAQAQSLISKVCASMRSQ